jgi:hypothetical protein
MPRVSINLDTTFLRWCEIRVPFSIFSFLPRGGANAKATVFADCSIFGEWLNRFHARVDAR